MGRSSIKKLGVGYCSGNESGRRTWSKHAETLGKAFTEHDNSAINTCGEAYSLSPALKEKKRG